MVDPHKKSSNGSAKPQEPFGFSEEQVKYIVELIKKESKQHDEARAEYAKTVDLSGNAAKYDLAVLENKVLQMNAALKADIYALKEELKGDNVALRDELKADNRALRDELKADNAALKESLAAFEIKVLQMNSALKEEFKADNVALKEELKADNVGLKEELKGDIAALRVEMHKLHTEMIRWFIGTVIAGVAVAVAIMKYWN
jgi:D-ribose pyranose/furanose isomerase RbsD